MSELDNPPTADADDSWDEVGAAAQEPSVSSSTGARTAVFADILGSGTEPAVPDEIDHVTREATRVAPERVDVTSDGFPNPLTECGCGECPARVDPLADEDAVSTAFSDVLDRAVWAAEECPQPRPVTVQRAGRIFYVYQTAAMNRPDWSSRLDDVKNTHGRYLGAERDLLNEWGEDVSTALLSLRLSPVVDVDEDADRSGDDYGVTSGPSDSSASGRRWVPPLVLDNRLSEGWGYVRDRLGDHLASFEWEYAWVVSTTESAASPHLHVYIWVRDPDDDLSVDHVRPAVESFVRNTRGADEEHHRVTAGESDAAVVETTPRRASIGDEQALYVFRERGREPFERNTAGYTYLLNQRPEWALKRVHSGESAKEDEREQLQGAGIAWVSGNDWIGSSAGF